MEIKALRLDLNNDLLRSAVAEAERRTPDASLAIAGSTVKRSHVVRGKGKIRGKVVRLPWSGIKDLFDYALPGVAELETAIRAALPAREGGWHVVAWGNVLQRGDFYRDHDHRMSGPTTPMNTWAGIYYVSAPPGSRIKFVGEDKPRDVTTGELLIFPAGLVHSVPVYDGALERVSIAFNARPA